MKKNDVMMNLERVTNSNLPGTYMYKQKKLLSFFAIYGSKVIYSYEAYFM